MSVEREGRRLLSVVDGFVEQPRRERPERVSLAALEEVIDGLLNFRLHVRVGLRRQRKEEKKFEWMNE